MSLRSNFVNLEGRSDFEVRWHDPDPSAGMFTAVLRVKNEARSLPWVLPGLFAVADEVLIVDNNSDDGTPDVAAQVAKELDAADRLTVLDYPFDVSRCGPDHLHTPPRSVHSLTYFYNWTFSHVRTRYNLKWDGDMVLTHAGERIFRDLRWQLEAAEAIVQLPRYPVYVESDDVAYLDAAMINREAWAWPNGRAFHFGKGFEWEVPVWPTAMEFVRVREYSCFELKWLDADEFSHWSETTDFAASRRTSRKTREMEVFRAVQAGQTPPGVHRVESPGDTHVIDVLRQHSMTELIDPDEYLAPLEPTVDVADTAEAEIDAVAPTA